MSDNDLLSCTNSLVTTMVVINHRNIPWGPRCLQLGCVRSSSDSSHLLGLPLVLHPIKARMGSPELWLSSSLVLTEDKYSSRSPVLHPIKAKMGPPEQDSNIKKSSASKLDEREDFVARDMSFPFLRGYFFRSRYSISYFEYQAFFVYSR